jgi:hypothetical protein
MKIKKYINCLRQLKTLKSLTTKIRKLDKKSLMTTVKKYKIFIKNKFFFNKGKKEHYSSKVFNQMIF